MFGTGGLRYIAYAAEEPPVRPRYSQENGHILQWNKSYNAVVEVQYTERKPHLLVSQGRPERKGGIA